MRLRHRKCPLGELPASSLVSPPTPPRKQTAVRETRPRKPQPRALTRPQSKSVNRPGTPRPSLQSIALREVDSESEPTKDQVEAPLDEDEDSDSPDKPTFEESKLPARPLTKKSKTSAGTITLKWPHPDEKYTSRTKNKTKIELSKIKKQYEEDRELQSFRCYPEETLFSEVMQNLE